MVFIVVCLLLENMIHACLLQSQHAQESVSELDVEAWSEQSAASVILSPKQSPNLRQNPLKDHIHFLPVCHHGNTSWTINNNTEEDLKKVLV